MTKHVFNANFVGPIILWSGEQAQAKKGPCGPIKSAKMEQSSSPKRSQQEAWKWATNPCSSLTKETTRDPYKRTKPLRMN